MKRNLYLLIFLLPMLFIITGCNANYDIKIKSNKTIEEKLTVTEDNDAIESYGLKPKEYISQNIDQYKNIKELSKIKYKPLYQKNESSIISTYTSSFDNFSSSQIASQIFSNINMSNTGSGFSFYMSNFNTSLFPQDGINVESKSIENMTIKIKSHYKVKNSNADKEDKESNIYTWKIDEAFVNNKNSVKLELEQNKRWDIIMEDFFNDNLVSIIVLSILIVIACIIAIRFYIKNKNANKI